MSSDEPDENGSTPFQDLAHLRDVEPPSSLVAGVMRRIAEPRPPSFWRWLRRPFVIEVRLTPLRASGLTLGLALVATLLVRVPRSGNGSGLTSAPMAGPPVLTAASSVVAPGAGAPVRVRFRLSAKGARRVALAGSFNQWRADDIVLEPVSDGGVFAGTVTLPPGNYEYMFVVDGKWITDPAADERRDDGFGRQNALLRI